MNRSGFAFHLRGFTLIELLVSLAIMLSLTTILLWRYPETSVRLTLANMTHAVSLLIREAQVRGSAIDSMDGSLGGYGVYLERSRPVVLFGDTVDSSVEMPYGLLVGNGLFSTSSPNETKTTTTLYNGFTISKLCVGTGFPFSCDDFNGAPINSLTIVFTRPIPLPAIYINGSKSTNHSAACIELRSPKAPLSGHVRSVQVFSSGMIKTDVSKCDNNPL